MLTACKQRSYLLSRGPRWYYVTDTTPGAVSVWGVSVQASVCPFGVCIQGGLCLGGLCPGGSQSKQVSVQEVSVHWVSVSRRSLSSGSLSQGCLSKRVSVRGKGLCPGGVCVQGCARFAEILSELTKTWSSGTTECGVWIGNCNVKVWKFTEHKLHNIWPSVKFQQNEHTPGGLCPVGGPNRDPSPPIWWTSGWYTSYWNIVFFQMFWKIHKSFYGATCFGLLATSALGFKIKVDSLTYMLLGHNGFLRCSSGATPADLWRPRIRI